MTSLQQLHADYMAAQAALKAARDAEFAAYKAYQAALNAAAGDPAPRFPKPDRVFDKTTGRFVKVQS